MGALSPWYAVQQVNDAAETWIAAENTRFKGLTIGEVKTLLCVFRV